MPKIRMTPQREPRSSWRGAAHGLDAGERSHPDRRRALRPWMASPRWSERFRDDGDEPNGPNDRPENPPQGLENVDSAPGNDGPAKASSGAAPHVSPIPPNPTGFRRVNVRMTLNGVMAC